MTTTPARNRLENRPALPRPAVPSAPAASCPPRLPAAPRGLLAMILFLVAPFATSLFALVPGVMDLLMRPDGLGTVAYTVFCALTLAVFLGLATALVRGVDRRPFRALGLRVGRRAAAGLAAGVAISLVVGVGGLALAHLLGLGRPDPSGAALLAGLSPATAVVLVLARSFLLQGIGEEVLMRGYVLQALSAHPRRAVVASAVLFTLPHLLSQGGQQGLVEHLTYLAVPFGFGLAAGMLAIATGSVWAAAGIHGGLHIALAIAAALGILTGGTVVWVGLGTLFILAAVLIGRWIPEDRWRQVAAEGPYGR